MLATADNELITKTGPGTSMGEVFRLYWHPVALSEEVPTPGCKPLQLKVLSEDRLQTYIYFLQFAFAQYRGDGIQ